VPGPVAYGRGGTDPTVTDADLLLGCLDPDAFLGGEMVLRTADVEHAVRTRLAEPLRLGIADAAAGVVEVVNESMAAAARTHLSEHGRDPAGFALLAFGGAGPVHAYGMAKILKSRRIIVPMRAGVMSAYGFLVAEPTVNEVRSLPSGLPDVEWQRVVRLYEDMRVGASRIFTRAEQSQVYTRRTADMRYLGQGSAIEVPLPDGALDKSRVPAIEQAFTEAYRRKFGRALDGPIEVVNWRLELSSPGSEVPLATEPTPGDPRTGSRPVRFPGHGVLRTEVYDRYALRPGTTISGPAVFEERESSCSFGPDCRIVVDDALNLIVDIVA
jgi:N-methylhydantoinase A